MAAARLLRVGLTGGIASGKSYVRDRLAAAGCATVDLDHVTHELLQRGGAAVAGVVEAFGAPVLAADGGIDRRALGSVVFASDEARRRLEAIVHPLVRLREAELAREAAAGGATLFVTDAALLVETGMHVRFDRLLVAHCGEDAQLRRLQARGLDEAAARARLAAQMPADEKRRFAHDVVDTSGSFAETDAQVADLLTRLRKTRRPGPLGLSRARAAAALRNGPQRGPRGLTPLRVLSDAAAGTLDLSRLARLLEPPAAGPWYEAATADAAEPGPQALCGALVVWCAARGADPPYVLGTAASVARLTHREPEAIAGAVLAALALWHVAQGGRVDVLTPEALAQWSMAARQHTGGAPAPSLLAELEAAGRGQGLAGTIGGCAQGLASALADDVRAPAERGSGELDETLRLLGAAAAAFA